MARPTMIYGFNQIPYFSFVPYNGRLWPCLAFSNILRISIYGQLRPKTIAQASVAGSEAPES